MRTVVVLVFLWGLAGWPTGAFAQPQSADDAARAQGAIWKTFATQVDVGSELNVRLRNGQRFRATLIAVGDDAMLLQPRTRVPVPVQPVPYEEIVTLERRESRGIGAGRAAAIGVASGAGAFVAILLILMAAFD